MPPGPTLMLAGLRSRWMIPFSCAASSASAICRAIASASGRGVPPPLKRSASVGPSTSSRTRPRGGRRLEAVDGGDVGMIERGQYSRLTHQAGDPLGVGPKCREDLDGDVAFERSIARAVDLAHPAGADAGEDLVWSESCPGRQCHQRPEKRMRIEFMLAGGQDAYSSGTKRRTSPLSVDRSTSRFARQAQEVINERPVVGQKRPWAHRGPQLIRSGAVHR